MSWLLPPELLVRNDCFVSEHQPPTLAAPNDQLDSVAEDATRYDRISQLPGTFEIVPGDLNRTLYQQRQWFCHRYVRPSCLKKTFGDNPCSCSP
jgi:hypothetical protein